MEWRLLAGVSPEDVRRLIDVAQPRSFRRGQVVFHAADQADALRRLLELSEVFDGTIPLTQEEIAQTAGTSRATVNRVLREEAAAGAVELGRGWTTILDAAALRSRATT